MARSHSRPVQPVSTFAAMNVSYGEVAIRNVSLLPPIPRQGDQEPAVSLPPTLRYLTVKKFAQVYSEVISEGATRHLIWQAEAYARDPKPGLKSNGFLPVIVRPPGQRKVLLDRVEFEKWLTSRQFGRV